MEVRNEETMKKNPRIVLNPCQICGEAVHEIVLGISDLNWTVQCGRCGVRAEGGTIEEAAAAWNDQKFVTI